GSSHGLGRLFGKRNQTRLSEGLYHFRQSNGKDKTRLHLRVDPDGSGTLLINASSILHLNPTAALIAFHHLKGLGPTTIQTTIQDTFSDTPDQIVE
ncbi:MAG: hypothetical protein R3339_06755, partial [Thermodesulfobacteriota bacterium]|nr:hypothetical protein [Thermodesulfobacteriota bacterium]